jgi:hypothetical protein
MLLRLGLRRHAQVDRVIARAGAFPAGDYRRWQIIGELATVDFRSAFDGASALIRSPDPASKTLGAEILDQLFVGMREGRRLVSPASELLRELCRQPMQQDPEVLAAALPPYAHLCDEAQPLLYELLDHPDSGVRRTAAELIAAAGAEFADDRQVDALIDLLDRDADPEVREQAAEGLELILTCYAYVPQGQRIAEVLRDRLDDPTPGIRAAAITAAGGQDVDATVKRLVAELTAQDEVAWQFVEAFGHLQFLDDCSTDLRAEAHRALRALAQRDWPEQADPSRFPGAPERADMLAKAIAATAPQRPMSLTDGLGRPRRSRRSGF